jgi:hypothetical protein
VESPVRPTVLIFLFIITILIEVGFLIGFRPKVRFRFLEFFEVCI